MKVIDLPILPGNVEPHSVATLDGCIQRVKTNQDEWHEWQVVLYTDNAYRVCTTIYTKFKVF